VNMEDKETKNRKKYRDDNNKDGKKASSWCPGCERD
jgi:hypothetical protein